MVDVTTVVSNYTTWVFGNPFYASLFLMFILVLVGIRFRFSLDAYIVLLSPVVFLLIGNYFPGLPVILWPAIGLLFGIGLLTLIRRT